MTGSTQQPFALQAAALALRAAGGDAAAALLPLLSQLALTTLGRLGEEQSAQRLCQAATIAGQLSREFASSASSTARAAAELEQRQQQAGLSPRLTAQQLMQLASILQFDAAKQAAQLLLQPGAPESALRHQCRTAAVAALSRLQQLAPPGLSAFLLVEATVHGGKISTYADGWPVSAYRAAMRLAEAERGGHAAPCIAPRSGTCADGGCPPLPFLLCSTCSSGSGCC